MVYSVQAIDGLDADVLTIENSRSGDEMITALAKYGYKRDIGPGESPNGFQLMPVQVKVIQFCKRHVLLE